MASRVVSPVLVGRREELARLAAATERAAAGEPSVALLVGEAGVGKTRLVDEATARAVESGARVLTGGCVQLGGEGLPFVPIVDALRQLVRTTPADELDRLVGPARRDLARLLPELDPEAAGAGSPDPGATSRLFEFVLGLVGRLAAERPLVLVVEDVHWADRSTLDLLAFLTRALRTDRVLLLATYRAEDVDRRHPLRGLLVELERLRNVERIELARFDRDEVVQQLRGILGEPPPADLAEDVLRRSEGNAFLVEELAAAGVISPALRDVLLLRVESLSPVAQQVLQAASAAGRRVGHRLLAAVVELPAAELAGALREAVAEHVLTVEGDDGGYAFRHALVAEAVYDDILPSERVRLHVACAEALERDATLADGGAALATMLAHHWYAAHDVTRALSASIEAARHASAAYAYAEAAQHLERALSTWPRVVDPEAQAGLDLVDLLQLASAAVARVGDVHRAVALLDQALSLVDREREPVRAALLLARRGRPQRDVFAPSALEDLQAAAALLPADAPERADVLGSLSAAALVGPGDFEMARQAAAEAVEVARALGQTRQAADALATLGPALLALGHREDAIAALEEGLRLATEAGDEHIQLRAHVNLSDVLGTLGRLEESAAVARRGTELAKEFGLSRTWGILLTANLAEALVTSGDWDEAAAALDEALSIAVAGPPEEWLLEMAAELALGRGELDEAARHLGASSDHGSDQLALGRAMLLAEQARCEGRLLDSRALLSASLDDRTFENQYTWPQVWLAMRVEADLAEAASADVARVVALVDSLAAVPIDAAPLRSYVALARGEQARATGEPQAAAWTEAVAAVREAGDLYRLAYAQRRLGEALVTDGDRQSAGEALGEAAAIAGRLGARPLLEEIRSVAQRARLEVLAGGEPAPVSDLDRFGLTSREIEVLRLVAEGRSNGEIAGALFISPKTASVHVSNILGKLSVASRGEAAAVAHRLRLFD